MSISWKRCAAPSVVVALAMGITAVARSQEPPPGFLPRSLPTPPGSAAPAASGSAAPVPAASAEIAPPGPHADPVKVEAAKVEAKKAALTPILPSPKNPARPAFQLYVETDLAALAIGAVFVAARFIKTQGASCAQAPNVAPGDFVCDRTQINGLDVVTAGTWNTDWSLASDIGLYSILGVSAVTLVAHEGVLDALNDVVVIAESAMTASALSTLAAFAANRPRPFTYGTDAPLSERTGPNSALSFVSSHASLSFAVAVSTYMATRRLNPGKAIPLIVLAIGGAAAAFVATARVEAGQHFITDSVAGALVGSAVGVAVPALHSSPVRIVPVVSQTQQGLGFTGTF